MQKRVSDLVRFVRNLFHSLNTALYTGAPTPEGTSLGRNALAEAVLYAPSTGKVGGCDSEHARSAVPLAWPTDTGECHAVRARSWQRHIPPAQRWPSVTLHRVARMLLLRLPSARCPLWCIGDRLPGASATMLISSRLVVVLRRQRQSPPVAARAVASKWRCRTWWKRVSYASEMHARLKALLERMAIDLQMRLDPVSAIL